MMTLTLDEYLAEVEAAYNPYRGRFVTDDDRPQVSAIEIEIALAADPESILARDAARLTGLPWNDVWRIERRDTHAQLIYYRDQLDWGNPDYISPQLQRERGNQ